VNSSLEPNATTVAPDALVHLRTSDVLLGVLSRNPGVQFFSVEHIIAAIGPERAEAALVLFSVPSVVPVQVPKGIVSGPAGAIGGHIATGRKQLRLPPYILKKQISRRALAIAIHAALPVIEAAERLVRPRWHWISHPISRRAIGLLIFLLAVAIAYPLGGAGALHAMSIFVLSLGLAEADGLAILIGVVAGVLSLAVVAVTGFSPRAIRKKVIKLMRKIGKKLGLSALARFLDRLGYRKIAMLLTLQWSDILMHWDPERGAPPAWNASDAKDAARASGAVASTPTPPPVYRARAHDARRPAMYPRSRVAQPASL
jgi:hypothetical protein